MADRPDAAKTAAVMSTAAAIASGFALIRSGKVAAAPGSPGAIPVEVIELLVAIAQSADNTDKDMDTLLDAVQNLTLDTRGWVPNADEIVSGRMDVEALNTARQLPHLVVPDDMEIQLKGWPANGGVIYVASSDPEAKNINSVWPLLPNEAIGYRIKNLNEIYFSGTAVGDWVCWTVENRK
ncbi:hypothetical protein LCGC14_1537530 [marine sediment metagenome]|uniref:Uncharacterized protein n=1 Tax=marine sediment metagenome TaxID=412755 RepID=A0A0F9IU35_9ZZZZ